MIEKWKKYWNYWRRKLARAAAICKLRGNGEARMARSYISLKKYLVYM